MALDPCPKTPTYTLNSPLLPQKGKRECLVYEYHLLITTYYVLFDTYLLLFTMLFDIYLLPETFIIARGESKGRWRHCFILLTQLKQPYTLTVSLQDVVACLPANRKDPNDNNAKVPWYRGLGIQVRLLTVQKPKLPMS